MGTALDYLDKSIATFEADPPDSEYQKGFLDALKVARAEMATVGDAVQVVDLGRDFTPTKEQITLHGLGFIQVKLPANRRLHVWHPDLPRRDCYRWSSIHNHRFGFRSTVLVGEQVNRRYNVVEAGLEEPFGPKTHLRISHDGPRSPAGGRESYVAGQARVQALPDEHYGSGQSYEMHALQYHETPNSGIVVTLMEKLHEGTIHASSLIEPGHEFHQTFNRFQWSEADLWDVVLFALKGSA